jgi:hypothetical protein
VARSTGERKEHNGSRRVIRIHDSFQDERCATMKLVTEYLEHVAHFERMANEADDPELKEKLLAQAEAYRKLAEKRAEQMRVPLPPIPPKPSQS